ncbi:MAG: NADPH-dependent 7-cyano-7-deazaguanine reductase QueF [Thermoleophilia bacterium]|nr:NADPH-dependent 7-cyano-7-deazaguanine reductase QueF [Thermoleophilia bacterium]
MKPVPQNPDDPSRTGLDNAPGASAGQELGELYGTRAIRENRLERWPNPNPERPYLIALDIPEFTCLCPRSGFPDFALIKIRYQPRDYIVELKSLKLYINGYRDRHISHEAACNQILDDLVALLEPRWMRVTADFNVRGNIKTVVIAEHGTRERG